MSEKSGYDPETTKRNGVIRGERSPKSTPDKDKVAKAAGSAAVKGATNK